MVLKMLSFRQFLVMEEKINKSKLDLQKLIKLAVDQFRQELNNNVILESLYYVDKLKEVDIKQTDGDRRTLTRFISAYNKLSQPEQSRLVYDLMKPVNGKILTENEMKLILIYKDNKESPLAQEIYNAIMLNKQELFQKIALDKVRTGQINKDQAPDYVQLMFLMLCGGGHYNAQNNGKYSLDGYDPYSGTPFNFFIQKYIAPAAFNKFQAAQDTSISNDYMKQRDNIEVTSAEDEKTKKEIESIAANNNEEEIEDLASDKLLLLKIIIDDDEKIPKEYRLKGRAKEYFRLRFFEGLPKREAGFKMGYSGHSADQCTYIMLRDYLPRILKAIKYLQSKNN